MPRIKEQKRMYEEERIEYTKEDVRFGTSEIVAKYRAKRLKDGLKNLGGKAHGNCLIEVGSSVGFQLFPFAETFKQVIAVEIDKRKLELAKKNAAVLGFKNVDFVLGDALDKNTIEQIRDIINEKNLKVESVFLDPERAESETERTLGTLKPDVMKFIAIYGKFTENIAIELPPYIKKEKLSKLPEHELEYISVDNNLNRLTAYFGNLKKADVSLTLLPEESSIVKAISEKKLIAHLNEITNEYKYFYEINPALLAADVLAEALVQSKIDLAEVKVFEHKAKTYLLSNKLLGQEIGIAYEVLTVTEVDDDAVKSYLGKKKAGKVILHGNIKQDEYFTLKLKFEKGLRGDKTLHLFLIDKCIICEKL